MTLEELRDACGTNKHDQVLALIEACILDGINVGTDIVATIVGLDFDPRHVGKLLKENAGHDPERHRWRKDEAGHYVLL